MNILRLRLPSRLGMGLGIAGMLLLQSVPPRSHAQQPASNDRSSVAVRQVGSVATKKLRLESLRPDELHRRLERILQKPLPASWDSSGRWFSFLVESRGNASVTLNINRETQVAEFIGPEQRAQSWLQVAQALDQNGDNRPGQSEIVQIKPRARQQVERAIRMVQIAQSEATQSGTDEAEEPTRRQPIPLSDQNNGENQLLGELAAGADAGLVGPVQIEVIDGLDMIVIRGSDADVARVRKIIDEIERISSVTAPQIEIHPLQHVEGRSLAGLLDRVYEQLGERGGDLFITPLGKPNALLLIGREENVTMAKELIDRLDQPVAATTRFEVYPLQNASASEVRRMINELLAPTTDGGDDEQVPTLLPTALVVADYRTNSIIVSASPRDLQEIAELVKRVDAAKSEAVDQVRVFPLNNTLAEDLAEVLTSAIQSDPEATGEEGATGRRASLELISPAEDGGKPIRSGILNDVRISPDTRANAIVVTAPAESMGLIAELIKQLDKTPDVEAQMKVFTLTSGDATRLVEVLRELFGGEGDDAGGLGAGQSGVVRIQLSVDERTNSVIAAGTADDLAVVEAVLLRLDEGDVRERVNTVYRLKNAFAQDVAVALNEWLQTQRDAEADAEIAISPFEQIEREVVIVPELGSNSLIVSATPRYYEELQRLIDELDERPPMVMIQVLIAEVRLNDTDEFGVELGLQDPLLFDRSVLQVDDFTTIQSTTQNQSAGGATVSTTQETIVNAPLNPGFNFNNQPIGNNGSATALAGAGSVAAQGLTNFAVNRISELNFGGLVLSASSNAVSLLLRALQENRRLEILSRPQIMTLDGQEGLVVVGELVPQILGVNLTQFGQQNTIDYRDVGLILRVRPRVSPDGMVVMGVEIEKSEVGPVAEGIPVSIVNGQPVLAPRIETTRAVTTVSALTGQTVVLSGLLTKRSFDLHRSVPFISDIPLLGDLFRYDSVSEERTELLIILTPQVVSNRAESEVLKQVESSRMSWVLCDVVQMHGEAGLKSRCDDWTADETESVYPTFVPVPHGETPQDGIPHDAVPYETIPTNAFPTTEPMLPLINPTPAESEPSPTPYLQNHPDFIEQTSFRNVNRLPTPSTSE